MEIEGERAKQREIEAGKVGRDKQLGVGSFEPYDKWRHLPNNEIGLPSSSSALSKLYSKKLTYKNCFARF